VTAAIGKVVGSAVATRLEDNGTAKHRAWLREKTQQQSCEESEATEDPSDFCDFGFDVVPNTDS